MSGVKLNLKRDAEGHLHKVFGFDCDRHTELVNGLLERIALLTKDGVSPRDKTLNLIEAVSDITKTPEEFAYMMFSVGEMANLGKLKGQTMKSLLNEVAKVKHRKERKNGQEKN